MYVLDLSCLSAHVTIRMYLKNICMKFAITESH
jgi:hypothetical protein